MYKQVIIARSDISMSTGKLAAQVAHASLEAALKVDKKILNLWRKEGAKKIVLKAPLRKIREIRKKAEMLKIPFALIKDAGLTELRAGTITALALGPHDEKEIDKLTGTLPLL